MKVLHTADWHLGQKLFHKSRETEHIHAINWLINTIKEEEINLLIIAGDVFDTDIPPIYARRIYFNFLKKLLETSCNNVVIVAGNHDSANMIDASKELFEFLNISVIGNLTENPHDQIVEIKDSDGLLMGVVAAVPYLKDKDMRKHSSGESLDEKQLKLVEGIQQHYDNMANAVLPYASLNIPIITTGHLYITDADRGERDDTIHIGSLGSISATAFPSVFDYVALGHLHRVQQVDKNLPVWYSGSLIPLDFSEINYSQCVLIVHFEHKKILKVSSKKVALLRKLRFYTGDLEYLTRKLQSLDTSVEIPTWIKIVLETEQFLPNILEDLEKMTPSHLGKIVQFKQIHSATVDQQDKLQSKDLNDLRPIDVFTSRLDQVGELEEKERVKAFETFQELLSWIQEKDQE